jgi:hypothetical protein
MKIERKMVGGRVEIVGRRAPPPPLTRRSEPDTLKRSAPSPDIPSSSKVSRTASPLPFDDMEDCADGDFVSLPSPDMEKGRSGKVAFIHMNVSH